MCLLPIRNPSSGPCLNHGRWIEKCMGNGVLFRLMVGACIVEALAASGEGKHIMFAMFACLCMVLVGISFSFLCLGDTQYISIKIGLYSIW